MNRVLNILLCLVFVVGSHKLMAQDIVVDGRFSKDSIEVGDQVEFILDVEVDRAMHIGMPDFGVVTPDAERKRFITNISTQKGYKENVLEVLKEYPVDTIKEDGRMLHLRRRYRFAVMETGTHELRPAVLYYPKNSDEPDTLYADYTVTLNVASYEELDTLNFIDNNAFVAPGVSQTPGPAVDTTVVNQLVKRDGVTTQQDMPFIIDEIIGLDGEDDSLTLIIIIISAIILTIAAICFVMEYRRRAKGDKEEPLLPAHIEANKALEELHHRKLWQNGKHKLYYTLLTDIMRRYISRRWGVRAMEQTTDQTLEALRECDMSVESRTNLATILRTADMAKYAKAEPEDHLNEECYTMAYYFVENTKQIDEQSVEGKNDITIETKIGE